jgi:hypothetical protein
MPLTFDQIVSVLNEKLTRGELDRGVAYVTESAVSGGTKLDIPRAPIEVPWDAHVGFIDREPMANWGHSCRYVLIGHNAGEYRSIEARFPPFSALKQLRWKVVYRAKGVPDSAIKVR